MRIWWVIITLLMVSTVGQAVSEAEATIVVSPLQPTVDDSVKVTVKSGFPSLCWTVLAESCAVHSPDTVLVSVSIQYCGGGAPCNCPQLPMAYQRTCNFGLMATGSYVARFDELHINPNDPIQSRTEWGLFTVQESTPAMPKSWGSLKISYR